MKRKPTLDDFQKTIKKIAQLMLPEIDRRLREKKRRLKKHSWLSAYLDARWSIEGDSRIDKVRVDLPNGKRFGDVDIPYDAVVLLTQIGHMKDVVFPEKWYGLKLTVQPDGECQLELNYDPECCLDPHWYES